MSLPKKNKKSYDGQWCMRFKTRHPDKDNYDGVVVSIADKFIAVREVIDFEFDGVVILPKRSIKGIRDNKYDQCCNEILRENGKLKKLKSPGWLQKCSSIPDVLMQLMKRDIWPAIEILFDNNGRDALYLGLITRIEEEHFSIRCYDAAGNWEKEYELTFDEIFRIEFDSRYCNNFNAYMRTKPFDK